MFHINGCGEVKPCKATIRSCIYSQFEHFDSLSEAKSFVEKKMSKEFAGSIPPTLNKSIYSMEYGSPLDNIVQLHRSLWRNRRNIDNASLERIFDGFVDSHEYYGLTIHRDKLLHYFKSCKDNEWIMSNVRKDIQVIIEG